jgi:hypothetical protein
MAENESGDVLTPVDIRSRISMISFSRDGVTVAVHVNCVEIWRSDTFRSGEPLSRRTGCVT